MSEWWEGLSSLLKILYCIAFPSTLLLIIQTLFSMFGMHDGGAGSDFSDTSGLDLDAGGHDFGVGGHDFDIGHHGFDTGHDTDSIDGGNPADFATMRLFTLQTVVAFFTVFSWSSIVLVGSDVPNIIAVIISFFLGVIVMVALAKLIQLAKKLTENGTVNLNNAIGENAVIYIPCPANYEGAGKVTATIQGQLMELSAVTAEKEMLKTGTQVRIIDLRGDTVVVEKQKD